MTSAGPPPRARQFIEELAAKGRYLFDSGEAKTALGISTPAVNAALSRLATQGAIASPARGFYVIVPPEYRSIRCLPADQFLPSLMERLALPYYVGLLTAAQYHGAAHQRPQEFQVFLERNRRVLECGKVRIRFLVRKRLQDVPTQKLNTPRGALLVSTPEATALDLVGYHERAGGLDQVATVLSELAEKIDAGKLATAAANAPVPWAQRLGYLLERVGASEKAKVLKTYVRAHASDATPLMPNAARARARRDEDWKLYVNADVTPDL
jgi:predicted transcriptional regulator of viral defense system